MKKFISALCIGFFIAAAMVCSVQKTEASLTNGIIRLHVRANSDSTEDQQLKLKVRDRILSDAAYLFENQTSIDDAEKIINENIELITAAAEDEIRKSGYQYSVSVRYGKNDFPEKVYKNITMPAGTYEALIVEIGSGKGQNWWCVLFPPLCFVDETCTGISEESKDILISNLGKDTYEMIQSEKKPNVKIKFKIYELWKNSKDSNLLQKLMFFKEK